MEINKFGGASIKDVESVKNVAEICKNKIKSGVVVISAMGKTTNLLESLALNYFNKKNTQSDFQKFEHFHKKLANELLPNNQIIEEHLSKVFLDLNDMLKQEINAGYDFIYDQIVPYGELASSIIVWSYFKSVGLNIELIDARSIIKTDKNHRNAKVMWKETEAIVKQEIKGDGSCIYLTQGFIGSTSHNANTTLGREGSDYTAAILAYILNAKKVVVWKDVPGIMNADPAWIPTSLKIDQLAHHDAIELAYYGAKVIHPKTIKPLQNKGIPLQVRSFIEQNNQGTIISSFKNLELPPIFIKKDDQVLITIKPTDYSFIMEENLSQIFNILAEYKINVNLMQNSAVSFSVVADNDMFRIKKAISILKKQFYAKYNDGLELITIRHHISAAENEVLNGRETILEQHTRTVARFLVRQ